ncbi:uncharacterized protein METZ01_LOCUS267867, partial [marine metagenome]
APRARASAVLSHRLGPSCTPASARGRPTDGSWHL